MNTQPQQMIPLHFAAEELINPTNAITVNVIGAGGTGSCLMSELADNNFILHALGHPGYQVRLFDADEVATPNVGRGKFSPAEFGLLKAVALVSRINRSYGFNWEAIPYHYSEALALEKAYGCAMITISCVDKVPVRFEIAKTLQQLKKKYHHDLNAPLYWIDCGNEELSGQAIMGTIGKIEQPDTKQYLPVANLPLLTEEFGHLLIDKPSSPSCSMYESISRQDPFINRAVASAAARLLWQLIRNKCTVQRGQFINLSIGISRPLLVSLPSLQASA